MPGEDNEQLRMRVAELEKSDIAVRKVFDILENRMQVYDDKCMKSCDVSEKVKLFDKWKALKEFREELEQTFGEEEEDGSKKNICSV
ncbi:hypothetical protein [Clostridium sp. HBUAS56010]|uniref:hypothetical protein n=1 Tax=Clostridium sp. HBUAS56010 TaxID=2571127 RepID=UPI001177BF74|nr:hypothetical protein [Clostridium sp. HBUAS56010]